MISKMISIPHAVELTEESCWSNIDGNKKRKFFIIRYHFFLKDRQANELPQHGEIITTFNLPENASAERIKIVQSEREIVNFTESVRQSLISHEFLNKLSEQISINPAKSLPIPAFEITSNWEEKMKTEFSDYIKYTTSHRTKENVTYQLNAKISGKTENRQLAVATYQRYITDVYLLFIDYLRVEYLTTPLGLRKKRKKFPPPTKVNGRKYLKHENGIVFDLPVATIKRWKLLEDSCEIIDESEYRNQVEDPDEIIISKPSAKKLNVNIYKEYPTLYQVSNIAFPLKWIHRQGAWTEEELLKLEMEEAKESAWWFQYGPGKSK